jgi:hypothetical protein
MESGCFTNEHDGRVRISRSKHDLGTAKGGEFAALAIVKRRGEFLKRHDSWDSKR